MSTNRNRHELGTKRDSGIELLRILFMFNIFVGHAISQTSMVGVMPLGNKILCSFITLSRPASLGFMLLSGTVGRGYTPTKAIRKAIMLWVKYVILLLLTFAFGIWRFKTSSFPAWWSFIPLCWRPLWFVTCYIMFLAFAPIIDAAYDSLQNDTKARRLVAGTVFFCIFGIGTLSPVFLGIDRWPTFYSELLVYVGAYTIMRFLREDLDLVSSRVYAFIVATMMLVYIIVYIFLALVLDYEIVPYIRGMRTMRRLWGFFASHIETIPMLIFAISVCIIAKRIKIKSEAVNIISSATLTVYVIHQSPFLAPMLWDDLFHVNALIMKNTAAFAVYMVAIFGLVYLVALITEVLINKVIGTMEYMIMKVVYGGER